MTQSSSHSMVSPQVLPYSKAHFDNILGNWKLSLVMFLRVKNKD